MFMLIYWIISQEQIFWTKIIGSIKAIFSFWLLSCIADTPVNFCLHLFLFVFYRTQDMFLDSFLTIFKVYVHLWYSFVRLLTMLIFFKLKSLNESSQHFTSGWKGFLVLLYFVFYVSEFICFFFHFIQFFNSWQFHTFIQWAMIESSPHFLL